jgi:hypothetical protein
MLELHTDARVAETEMRAILFVLVAFAHIDGAVHASERDFIQDTIDAIVGRRARELYAHDPDTRANVIPLWKAHFYHAATSMEQDIRADFSESVSGGETAYNFVYARLKLRCFETLAKLERPNQMAVLGMVDNLMLADGVVHPAERGFRDELFALLEEEPTRVSVHVPRGARPLPTLEEPRPLPARAWDHPFFSSVEHAYVYEPATLTRQSANDIDIIRQVEGLFAKQRADGHGRLDGLLTFADVRGDDAFLDGYVHVHPAKPGVPYELLVIGDLHGCYSCLKAALLQADFVAKVEAYGKDPDKHPYPLLVFLGDYIDRGRHSYDGVLRTVLRLYLAAPQHVVVLRGNHEHYIERSGGQLGSPVRPAEAIDSIAGIAPRELLLAHMRLFDRLPSMLVFDRMLFVHAGIPRDDTMADKLKTLSALNDPEVRLQMAWSDPSDADFVPLDLQRANTRFPFGRMQFRSFMARLGVTTLVRGHERVVEGVRRVYADPDLMLLSVFSAGGSRNTDLPTSSNYREVTPMALTIRHESGQTSIQPFPIAYERWNDPAYNGFLRARVSAPPG